MNLTEKHLRLISRSLIEYSHQPISKNNKESQEAYELGQQMKKALSSNEVITLYPNKKDK